MESVVGFVEQDHGLYVKKSMARYTTHIFDNFVELNIFYAETIEIDMRGKLFDNSGFFLTESDAQFFKFSHLTSFFSSKFQLARLKVAKMSYAK